ncbi:MAG: adenylosuccinate synthetase [Promethearchaeota archaeon]
MSCTILVGGFFGDEGKGKIISHLSIKDKPDIVARAGVGTNAGHTVQYGGETYKLRQIPSGFIAKNARILIGPGVLVDPNIFLSEVELTGIGDRVGIDKQCGVIEQKHIDRDKSSTHLKGKIGSTGTGCGPANVDRVERVGIVAKEVPELKKWITDVPLEINQALNKNARVLVESSQGTYISLYHGTYPYCTSKDVCAAAACSDLGIGPTRVTDVIVVFKAYTTRVGGGPLPEELSEEESKRRGWFEVATVTGRKRRSAPFNFELAKRAVFINGATQLAVTKLDILYPECKGAQTFDELPDIGKNFIRKIEEELKLPVTLIGTGPDAVETIDRRPEIG